MFIQPLGWLNTWVDKLRRNKDLLSLIIWAHSISYLCVGCCDWQKCMMSVWKDRCLLYGVRKQREGTGRAGDAVTQVVTAGKVQFQSEQGILDSFEFCNDDWWISICTLRLILKGDQKANKPTKSHVSGQVQFFSSFCGAQHIALLDGLGSMD